MIKQSLFALAVVFSLLFSSGAQEVYAVSGQPIPGDNTILPLPGGDIAPNPGDGFDIYPLPNPGDSLDAVKIDIDSKHVNDCGVKHHQDPTGKKYRTCLQEWCTKKNAGGHITEGSIEKCDSKVAPYDPNKVN